MGRTKINDIRSRRLLNRDYLPAIKVMRNSSSHERNDLKTIKFYSHVRYINKHCCSQS